MMPLRVGCNAVVRRVNREANPHDCIGPSKSKARQQLADMVGEGCTELIQCLSRQVDFDLARNSPGFFESSVMCFEVFNGLLNQPLALGANGILKRVDQLDRLSRRLERSEHVRRFDVGVHRIFPGSGDGF